MQGKQNPSVPSQPAVHVALPQVGQPASQVVLPQVASPQGPPSVVGAEIAELPAAKAIHISPSAKIVFLLAVMFPSWLGFAPCANTGKSVQIDSILTNGSTGITLIARKIVSAGSGNLDFLA
jgi:hypothetical protein